MACFVAASDAVAAAHSIFENLDDFNQNENRLQKTFRLRMGIHTGSVIVEKSGRINEMFSEALDVAGHIQKSAEPNRIEISTDTLHSLDDRNQWETTERILDGSAVYTSKQKEQ
jgi:class 3 adenylate cyclase